MNLLLVGGALAAAALVLMPRRPAAQGGGSGGATPLLADRSVYRGAVQFAQPSADPVVTAEKALAALRLVEADALEQCKLHSRRADTRCRRHRLKQFSRARQRLGRSIVRWQRRELGGGLAQLFNDMGLDDALATAAASYMGG